MRKTKYFLSHKNLLSSLSKQFQSNVSLNSISGVMSPDDIDNSLKSEYCMSDLLHCESVELASTKDEVEIWAEAKINRTESRDDLKMITAFFVAVQHFLAIMITTDIAAESCSKHFCKTKLYFYLIFYGMTALSTALQVLRDDRAIISFGCSLVLVHLEGISFEQHHFACLVDEHTFNIDKIYVMISGLVLIVLSKTRLIKSVLRNMSPITYVVVTINIVFIQSSYAFTNGNHHVLTFSVTILTVFVSNIVLRNYSFKVLSMKLPFKKYSILIAVAISSLYFQYFDRQDYSEIELTFSNEWNETIVYNVNSTEVDDSSKIPTSVRITSSIFLFLTAYILYLVNMQIYLLSTNVTESHVQLDRSIGLAGISTIICGFFGSSTIACSHSESVALHGMLGSSSSTRKISGIMSLLFTVFFMMTSYNRGRLALFPQSVKAALILLMMAVLLGAVISLLKYIDLELVRNRIVLCVPIVVSLFMPTLISTMDTPQNEAILCLVLFLKNGILLGFILSSFLTWMCPLPLACGEVNEWKEFVACHFSIDKY